LLLLVAACAATPPPLRVVPPGVWDRGRETVRARNEHYEAKQLTVTIRGLLSEPDSGLGEDLRQEIIASLRELDGALEARDVTSISRLFPPLAQRVLLVVDHRRFIAEVGERRGVVGAGAASSVDAEIDQTIAQATRALSGVSWEDVRATRDELVHLSEQKLAPARFLLQLQRELLGLGEISPELRRQMSDVLQPLQRALQAGSWEDMREQAAIVPVQARYPRRIHDRIEQGDTWMRNLQPQESQAIASALATARAALQGDSWEEAMVRADAIAAAAEKFGLYGDATPCVRILSIDGGGIRGIIPALFLEEIERRTNASIFELFDLIAGTSTGGILTLGLTVPDERQPNTARYKASDLVEMYEKEGKAIFPSKRLKGIRSLAGPKYRADPLERVLHRYFGDAVLIEALTNVLIPAYSLERPGHVMLNTYGDGLPHVHMWEVARATSAAPTYFPPYRIPLDPFTAAKLGSVGLGLIDGGVFANNPAVYALALAKRYEHGLRHKPYDLRHPLLMLSLGTGRVPSTTSFDDAWDRGAPRWISPLINILLSDPGVEDEAHDLMALSDQYVRLQPQLPNAASAQLDNADPENIERLKQIAEGYMRSQPARADLERISALLLRRRPAECERIVDPLGEREFAKALQRLGR
jgi:hypothetical protein